MKKTICHAAIFCLIFTTVLGQKITIQFDAPLTTPPSVAKAFLKYNKDFAYSFTLDDATDDAMTTALPVFKGGLVRGNGQIYTGLFYTDGCGNDIPFRCGLAWNTANLANIDVHTGNVEGQLTWKQLDTLYDLGWDVFNHSYTHRSRWNGPMSGNDYVNEIEQNSVAVRNKTQKRLEMPLFVVPSGDTFYNDIAYRQGSQLVFNQPGNSIGFGGLNVTSDSGFERNTIHRMEMEESIKTSPSFIDRAVAKTTGGNKIWYNEFTHRIDNFNTTAVFGFKDFYTYMKRAADTWGKNGFDNMWMAPLQEVYEYLQMRRYATFTTSGSGNKLDLTFDLYNVPKWLRRKTLTLVVNSSVNFSNVIVPSGVKVTFKGTGNQKLINLDFTDFKTTSIFDEKTTPSVLKVFPNPITDYLTVELPAGDDLGLQLTVYNTLGRIVLTEKTKGKTARLNTTSLPHGQYFLLVRQGQQFYRQTFIR
ncbi:MAG: T9SS type A sorting domain-containing protein [Saprospiraceae bacterium]|nr:T9SS type A sorting domain-containing protein [Saprospiraceae bacterium]